MLSRHYTMSDLKLLIRHNKLLPLIEDQCNKLATVLDRPMIDMHAYSIYMQEYSYLCRKARQLRRLHEIMHSRNRT
jgi:hypothetical protein